MAIILETLMLILFGLSWPASVYKSWRSRSTGGKSLLFLGFVALGYTLGLIGKIFFAPSYVIIVYCINLSFVLTDIVLYFRNRRVEKSRAIQPLKVIANSKH